MATSDDTNAQQLHNAGKAFYATYQQTHALSDIDSSIDSLRRAVELAGDEPNITKAIRLNDLGNSLLERFEAQGNIADLNAAVDVNTKAAELIPDTSPDKSAFLSNLGNTLRRRFLRFGQLLDADHAVEVNWRAVELIQENDARRPLFMMNHGLTLRTRFDVTGQPEDLDGAISTLRQALGLLPEDHPQRASVLNNVGVALVRRFERSSNIIDIDEAVDLCSLSVQLTPDGSLLKAARWQTLANALDARNTYLVSVDVRELDAAVYASRQASLLLPDEHRGKSTSLNTLCLTLWRRWRVTKSDADKHDMVIAGRQAVALSPEDSPDKAHSLNTLGVVLLHLFFQTGEASDLNAAVSSSRRAVEISSMDSASYGWRSYNLAAALEAKFWITKHSKDIDMAIDSAWTAVEVIRPDEGFRSAALLFLAALLTERHNELGEHPENTLRAQLWEAVTRTPGTPQIRFEGARKWAHLLLDIHGAEASMEAWVSVVALASRLSWMDRSLEAKLSFVKHTEAETALAVDTALSLNDQQWNRRGIEWLEESRSFLWGQNSDLHAPLNDIRSADSSLADELELVSARLSTLGFVASPEPGTNHEPTALASKFASFSIESEKMRRSLAVQFESLVERARKLPGCEEFLKMKTNLDLHQAAADVPIIVLLQCDNHCRVVVAIASGFENITLAFTRKMAEKIRDAVNKALEGTSVRGDIRASGRLVSPARHEDVLEKALRLMWTQLVRPLLDEIKHLLTPGSTGNLPRVMWSPTGVLSFLPFHAAGIYSGERPEAVYDRVVSSYTPSITTLIEAQRRRAAYVESDSVTPSILAVSQPATPGQVPLPGTRREVETLTKMIPQTTWLDGENATRDAVLEHMKSHTWIHLACHGIQDPKSFTDSAFMLQDGPLRLSDIASQSFQHTQFAFLSACQTATGDLRFPNENLHLAAGMLNAGFGSVCATVWSIHDDDGPVLAEKLYASLLKDGCDSRRSAYALHYAAAALRDQVGSKSFVRWAPFIHMGL